MSAVVIPLPTAAAQPVIQPKRRGRFPRNVVSHYRFVSWREMRALRWRAVQDALAGLELQEGIVMQGRVELARARARFHGKPQPPEFNWRDYWDGGAA